MGMEVCDMYLWKNGGMGMKVRDIFMEEWGNGNEGM